MSNNIISGEFKNNNTQTVKLNKSRKNSKEGLQNYSESDVLFVEDIVNEVTNDFNLRQRERKSFESKWQLNINFLLGNQYCSINGNSDIINYEKQFFWQEREVFNHIAPIIELRLSKLAKVRPTLSVVPFSDEINDIASAKVGKNILKATSYKLNLSELIQQATMWSEICGTSFYKITWNAAYGNIVGVDGDGQQIKEGDVSIDVISPFEIFPDSNSYENINDCKSIIHAKAYHTDTIKNIWGVEVEGKEINVFSLDSVNNVGGLGYISSSTKVTSHVKHNHALVIEKYEAPSLEYPNGKLTIVAGDKLLFIGELPYENMNDAKRGFPFIKQCSISSPNNFWGLSIIERCIPIQRAYNAVKNRKHEFLNRISMGVLAVEDGSVDTENLEEEGLSPGKVLVYRQGSNIPRLLSSGSVPSDFTIEEERLLNEFLTISGVSDLLRSASMATNLSGVALQLLIEQDEARLINSAEQIRSAIKHMAKHILRLYKQFAVFPKTSRLIGGDGSVELFYWSNSDINSDDVVFETENEINESLAQKRSMIFEILNAGLLHDENGKITNSMRHKILEQLGFGIWENSQDIKTLQIKQAQKENLALLENGKMEDPKEIDDHVLHIYEHTCFMLSEEYGRIKNKNTHLENAMLEHIRQHKKFNQLTQSISEGNAQPDA